VSSFISIISLFHHSFLHFLPFLSLFLFNSLAVFTHLPFSSFNGVSYKTRVADWVLTAFRCPFPHCGREFNVNSNMRRHYRNHQNASMQQQQHPEMMYPTSGYPLAGQMQPPHPAAGQHQASSHGGQRPPQFLQYHVYAGGRSQPQPQQQAQYSYPRVSGEREGSLSPSEGSFSEEEMSDPEEMSMFVEKSSSFTLKPVTSFATPHSSQPRRDWRGQTQKTR
jgi:hypothetical protein